MKANSLRIAAIAAALALTAGCGKKQPKEIPPPPIGSEGATDEQAGTGDPSGGVGTVALPGSRGDLIAFTKIAGNFRIGVMSPDGGGERLLTNSWQDEGPTWSPNGRVLQFFRTSQGRAGSSSIWQVDLTGVNERRIPTKLEGSDPTWGPLLP